MEEETGSGRVSALPPGGGCPSWPLKKKGSQSEQLRASIHTDGNTHPHHLSLPLPLPPPPPLQDLSYRERHWHSGCFLCGVCSRSLVDRPFATKADLLMCVECYSNEYSSKCHACVKTIMPGVCVIVCVWGGGGCRVEAGLG